MVDSERAAVDNRYRFESNDPTQTAQFIARLSTPYRPQFTTSPESPDAFRFSFTSIGIDELRIQAVECSLSGRLTIPPSGAVTVTHLLAGSLAFRDADDHEITMGRGASLLFQSHGPVEVSWSDLRVGVVRLELSLVEKIAAQEYGIEAGALRFLGAAPRSSEAERYWQSAVRMVNREVLPNEFASHNAVVRHSVERWLVIALLQTFPNTATEGTRDGLAAGDERLTSAALRRAADFIRNHAGEAIVMDDIAGAARVTARSLQHGFRHTWNTTPTAYLRQVRLERAHRDLQAADAGSGDTVAAIAAKWGFGNVGRFAARYREIYGRAPHEVLRS